MSETWITLAAEAVLTEFTPQESALIKNIQSAEDNLPDLVARVTEAIREAYRSGGRELGAEGMIPAGLESRAIDIARWRYLISNPSLVKLQTKEREKSHDSAMDYLKQIAMREIKGSGSAQIVSKQTRRATRERQSGLL